jgi:hypothetical protein
VTSPLDNYSLSILNPQPGDIVSISVPYPLPQEMLERLAEQLKLAFPDNKCVVTDKGASLSVEDDAMRRKVDELATEFERRSKEAHDRKPDSVPSMTRDNAVWASYRDAAYELRTTFGVPFKATDDQLEEGAP